MGCICVSIRDGKRAEHSFWLNTWFRSSETEELPREAAYLRYTPENLNSMGYCRLFKAEFIINYWVLLS